MSEQEWMKANAHSIVVKGGRSCHMSLHTHAIHYVQTLTLSRGAACYLRAWYHGKGIIAVMGKHGVLRFVRAYRCCDLVVGRG